MRTSHKAGAPDVAGMQQDGEIVGFGVPRGGRGRTAVPAAVIPDDVELFTEDRPYQIPNGRVRNTVVNQNDRVGTRAAFFEVEFRAFDIDKLARDSRVRRRRLGFAWSQKPARNSEDKNTPRQDLHRAPPAFQFSRTLRSCQSAKFG